MKKKYFLKDLGKSTAELRKSHHETQRELEHALANIISNHPQEGDGSTVRKWEHGENEMTHLEFAAICRRYQADANELLGLSPQKDMFPKKRLSLSLKERIGYWIGEYRRAHHETQQKLAEVLKCTSGTISKYETGVNEIPISKFKIICERYNIDAHDLLELPQAYKKITK